MVLSNVQRTSSRQTDRHEADKGFVARRYIQAAWKPEDYYFELITEEGEKRADLPVSVHIGIGELKQSSFAHWNGVGEIEEQFNASIYVPQDIFDWLWDEIESRPSAGVGVRADVMLLLAGIEASMYYEVHYNPIRLEPEERVAILDISIGVSDLEPEPQEDTSANRQEGSFFERLGQSFETATIEVWLKWIFFALIVVALILLFKR
jgi:hypothetical protein